MNKDFNRKAIAKKNNQLDCLKIKKTGDEPGFLTN